MPDQPAIDRVALGSAVACRYDALASAGSLSCGGALRLGAPAPGEVVVDLGCGRGRDVLEAARRVGQGGAALGVDLSAEMIERARASAAEAGATNVRFLQCELERLSLEDGSADLVLSNCAINHAPDKAAVFREVRRVLRPGGRAVVSDIVSEEELPEAVRSDPTAWAACYGGAIREPDYLEAVRAAGFATVEVLERSAPYERHGVSLRSLTIRASGLAGRKPPAKEEVR